MKDIKSVLIGFLLATCCFLFMGQTSDNDIGKYQMASDVHGIKMIDTRTGQLWEKDYAEWWERIAPNRFDNHISDD